MDIAKALKFLVDYHQEDTKAAAQGIVNELTEHLDLWVEDKQQINELTAMVERLRHTMVQVRGIWLTVHCPIQVDKAAIHSMMTEALKGVPPQALNAIRAEVMDDARVAIEAAFIEGGKTRGPHTYASAAIYANEAALSMARKYKEGG